MSGGKESAYEFARRRGREELRAILLDTASRLLTAEGSGALTLRRIAAEVGCSTTVLYTMFGSKDGLAEALYREGFERFRDDMECAPSSDPLAHLYEIVWKYRSNALAAPNYYGLMFGQAIPGFTPSPEALTAAKASFGVLVDAARACVEAGVFVASDPEKIAEVLWAAAHGVVSLELGGRLDSGDAERYETAVTAATSWFLISRSSR